MTKEDLVKFIASYIDKLVICEFNPVEFQYLDCEKHRAFELSEKFKDMGINHTFSIQKKFSGSTFIYRVILEYDNYENQIREKISNAKTRLEVKPLAVVPQKYFDDIKTYIDDYGKSMVLHLVNYCIHGKISFSEYERCPFYGIENVDGVLESIKELLQFKDLEEGEELRDAVVMWRLQQ